MSHLTPQRVSAGGGTPPGIPPAAASLPLPLPAPAPAPPSVGVADGAFTALWLGCFLDAVFSWAAVAVSGRTVGLGGQ